MKVYTNLPVALVFARRALAARLLVPPSRVPPLAFAVPVPPLLTLLAFHVRVVALRVLLVLAPRGALLVLLLGGGRRALALGGTRGPLLLGRTLFLRGARLPLVLPRGPLLFGG